MSWKPFAKKSFEAVIESNTADRLNKMKSKKLCLDLLKWNQW
jgi:hypothetical protein